jgi:hypothetical protein
MNADRQHFFVHSTRQGPEKRNKAIMNADRSHSCMPSFKEAPGKGLRNAKQTKFVKW